MRVRSGAGMWSRAWHSTEGNLCTLHMQLLQGGFFFLIGGLWSNVASSLYLWLQSTFFRNMSAFLQTSMKSKTELQNHLGIEFSVYSVISSEFLAFLCIFREGDAASSSASFVCGQTLEWNNSWGARKWQRSPLHVYQCLSVFRETIQFLCWIWLVSSQNSASLNLVSEKGFTWVKPVRLYESLWEKQRTFPD